MLNKRSAPLLAQYKRALVQGGEELSTLTRQSLNRTQQATTWYEPLTGKTH